MAIAIIFIFLLIGLICVFQQVVEWFEENKGINIIPAALIETIAGVIIMVNYGSSETKDIIWMWVAIAIVFIIIVFNLIRYRLKDGALASFAELVFSIPAAFLIICALIASTQKGNKKRKK